MTIKFENVFRDIIFTIGCRVESSHPFTATILVPPNHARPIQMWHSEYVRFYSVSNGVEGPSRISFFNPGDKILYSVMGRKLEIIIAVHEGLASMAYLDAVKEHSIVN